MSNSQTGLQLWKTWMIMWTSISLEKISDRVCIKISAKEHLGHYKLKQHKLWFDKECSKLLDRRKQAKLQWLQNPSQMHGNNMNNNKNKTIRHLYKGINTFKKGYQT
jgi:hypothetical protein